MRAKQLMPDLTRKAALIGIAADPNVCIEVNGQLLGIKEVAHNGHCIILRASGPCERQPVPGVYHEGQGNDVDIESGQR